MLGERGDVGVTGDLQTRFAFARIIGTTGPNITHLIPSLMANLLAHFEPSELADFMNFIGLLIHKLQVRSAPAAAGGRR